MLIDSYIQKAIKSFDTISYERKIILLAISRFVENKLKTAGKAELNYICRHNSRRSHFGQIWGQTAASYYQLKNVLTYSGGTEATAFNPNAIAAIQRVGFRVRKVDESMNPHYLVAYSASEPDIVCFSKTYNAVSNPQQGFCAVMTCTEADGNCPIIAGAELRVSCPYDDPKAFDGTQLQDAKYDERCLQIATETLWAFSQVKI